eukprot:TRINITY_DN175_c0_g1_i20.p1 TRINITY_DN175_c0_g1~~TRINITY_DN175_c0_g1_i20.p1  ORF type:complete len:113 (-),score=26.51 TRINITY_DN175_c0_g1_i20:161-499(-)
MPCMNGIDKQWYQRRVRERESYHIKLSQEMSIERIAELSLLQKRSFQTYPQETDEDDLSLMESDPIIELNVGGKHFSTLKSTLCKYPDSLLAEMFNNDVPLRRDEFGRFLNI